VQVEILCNVCWVGFSMEFSSRYTFCYYGWQNRSLSFQIVAVYFNPPTTSCMLPPPLIAVPTQLAGSYVGDDLDPNPGGILLPGSLGEGDVLNFAHQIAKGLHHLEKLKVRWRYVFYCSIVIILFLLYSWDACLS